MVIYATSYNLTNTILAFYSNITTPTVQFISPCTIKTSSLADRSSEGQLSVFCDSLLSMMCDTIKFLSIYYWKIGTAFLSFVSYGLSSR